jgi:cell wall-associated NlpC family hydrolase
VDGILRPRPLGAILADDSTVVAGEALSREEAARAFPRDAEAIARTAVERFSGTPYQWGGITPWGADCSGLVQTCFGLHGVAMPRDAWQQAELGRDAGRDPASLRAADLLFFSDRDDGRITHVGICAGPLRMVHLALGRGGWAVERLDAREDAYVVALMGRFRCARRVLG